MSNTFLYSVSSVPGVNFIEPLAAAGSALTPPYVASAMNNIPGVPAIGSRRFLIRALKVIAKQNFGPELNFFRTALGLTADPATDQFLSKYQFISANGEQINAAGLYRYYVDGLAIPYHDGDMNNQVGVGSLHVIMQNVDTIAKLGDVAGSCSVTAWLEPFQAY